MSTPVWRKKPRKRLVALLGAYIDSLFPLASLHIFEKLKMLIGRDQELLTRTSLDKRDQRNRRMPEKQAFGELLGMRGLDTPKC